VQTPQFQVADVGIQSESYWRVKPDAKDIREVGEADERQTMSIRKTAFLHIFEGRKASDLINPNMSSFDGLSFYIALNEVS